MTETQVDHPVRTFFLFITSVAIFSAMNMIAKLSAAEASVAQIVFFRSALAFVPILLLMNRMGGVAKLVKTENHLGHFWRGTVGVLSMVCFFASFAMLPMANATAIHFASPLFMTVMSIPMLGERVGKVRWMAVIIGLAGVLFMINPGDGGNLVGNLTALAAAFLAAFAMIYIRKLGRTEHALTIVFYFTLYGAALGGIGMAFMWQNLGGLTLYYLLLVGLLGGIGQIFLTYAYAHAPAAYVAPFTYLAMLFAVFWDVVIWGVWPGWEIYTGSAVIIGSGLFIVYWEAKKKRDISTRAIYALQPAQPTPADIKSGTK